jgi:hypothetical protein
VIFAGKLLEWSAFDHWHSPEMTRDVSPTIYGQNDEL